MPSSGSDVPEHIASTPVNFVIGGLKHAPSNAAAAKAGGSVITKRAQIFLGSEKETLTVKATILSLTMNQP